MPIKYDPFKDDPEIDPALLREANLRHDQAPHSVSMDRKARYRGDFRRGLDPAPRPVRTLSEWQKQFSE